MKTTVTGSKGFIGRNLMVALARRQGVETAGIDEDAPEGRLEEALADSDFVFHLAGVNRPRDVSEFRAGNVDSLARVLKILRRLGRRPLITLSSSTQAELDNPYGRSKRDAEELLAGFGKEAGCEVRVFRLPGVFGKWCRPDYNSVVATFCHNMARDLPIIVSDPEREIALAYVNDVVREFTGLLDKVEPQIRDGICSVKPEYKIRLNKLAETIKNFRNIRNTLVLPDFSDEFTSKLYATYISYLKEDDFSYPLQKREDNRGVLAEMLKSPHFGQIFVSRTNPGITRGNHYHDTKIEKFLVIEGDAIIRFRHILSSEVIEYKVSGTDFKVVDIPPGYTHSIENVGSVEMITLFWANEVFEHRRPDTFAADVR